MKQNEQKYFQFPLFLLRDLMTNKEQCFDNIIDYGVYDFANKNSQTGEQVYNYFDMTGDFENAYQRGKRIAERIPDKEPIPMIDSEKLFEYRDNEKSEFELLKFAFTIGMRSILGKKPYCKTTKEMIFARALGCKNQKELKEYFFTNRKLKKYFNRYQTDKILNEIEVENWNLFRYSSRNMRGLYIAKKRKITLEKLIDMVEENNKKRKIEKLKNEKKRLREKAIERLKEQHHNDNLTTT